MAEGTKNLATDAQRVAQVKSNHKIMAIDPDTGMMVFMEPGQLVSGPIVDDMSDFDFNLSSEQKNTIGQ